MIIDQHEILPGQNGQFVVDIARLPSRSNIDLTIFVNRAKEDGPVLLLMGGMHGDEINGIEIVRRINEQGLNIPKRGTVISIPILNVYGFIHFSRFVPDGKDVNRSFPGSKTGSLASRVAHYLMHNILPHIDYGIDYHTGGAERTNYPQIRCMLDDEKNAELAAVFAAPFTLHSPYRPKSLRSAAAKKGKRVLVFEGGESIRMDEFAIKEAIDGTLRVMKHLGMRDEAPAGRDSQRIIKSSSWVRAKFSGIFLSDVNIGQRVSKHDILGSISDPFGDFKHVIKCTSDGYVIGLNNHPVVHQGDALMHIGRPGK